MNKTLSLRLHLVQTFQCRVREWTLKNNTLWIYLSESELDRLVTKALILGDFGRDFVLPMCRWYADDIPLAVNGGHELSNNTRKVYFLF